MGKHTKYFFYEIKLHVLYIYKELAIAKFTSFSFLLKNENANFRERRRIFQRTKTHISENEDT